MSKIFILVVGCICAYSYAQTPARSHAPEQVSVMLAWQDDALAAIQKYQLNPLRAARVLAHLNLGMYRVRTVSRDVEGGSTLGQCGSIAMGLFAGRALTYFFPLETEGRYIALSRLRHPKADSLCPNAGVDADQEFLRMRQFALSDWSFPPRRIRTNISPAEGSWKPAPPVFVANPVEPYAGEWKTFFLSTPSEVQLPAPPAANSTEYSNAVRELLKVAASLNDAQRAAAQYWHLEAGSVTPAGVWILKLRELLTQHADANVDQVLLFAVFNMAMYDAMIACWHYKYVYWTERPITAAARLGLGEVRPLLVTPAFPAYPSGHATLSGTAAVIVGHFLSGARTEAKRLADEAAMSRLWGGIHLRFDNDAGLRLGEQIAVLALARFR
jgi:PAP2 superfamily